LLYLDAIDVIEMLKIRGLRFNSQRHVIKDCHQRQKNEAEHPGNFPIHQDTFILRAFA
jgi:hypothetical protein